MTTYYSRNRYTGDGATVNRTLTFSFLDRADVRVSVNGVDTAFSWITDSQISISPAPANGTNILIYRSTPKTNRDVVWQDGSGLTSSDQNTEGLQLFYISQEAIDIATDALPIAETDLSGWNAGSKRVINVADAVAANDAPNLAQVQSITASDATNAAASATLASQWATQTTGLVAGTDDSAKAYAIGGTGVTNTSGKGASKEWATKTSSTVDTTEFSAKEYAQGSQASTGGSSKNWAQQTGADVTGAAANSRSAKSWSQDDLHGATLGGSAKDWANNTAAAVDGASGYSSKEYAQGTQASTGGSAKNWAQQTGADVTGAAANSRSAKSWAQDDLHGATLGGSAKDWAQSASLPDGTNKSAKSYALDASTSASSAATSATNASTSASAAASSAAAAAASAASGLYETVVAKSFSDSPIAVAGSDEGTLYMVDTSGGNVVINLSALSTYGQDMKLAVVKMTGDANTVTVNRGGTDTISGGTSKVISVQYEVNIFAGDSATGKWVSATQSATIADDAVTFAKMQNISTDTLIGRDTAGTGDPEAITVGGGIEFTGSGGIQTSAFTGDVTKSAGGTATTIANDAVTYAKMQNVSATSRILGRKTAGAGDPEECTLSQILDFVGSAADGDILYRSAGAWTRLPKGTDTNVLTLASGLPSWAAPAAAGVVTVKKQIFTASGTYTPSTGMLYCIIECVGSGAGGGGANASVWGCSGGGGGGSYSRTLATAASVGASQTVTVGAAGTGGNTSGTNGTNGADVSVGALCIGKGGSLGTGKSSGTTAATVAGGAGGVAGTGDFTLPGGDGGDGFAWAASQVFSGKGGDSYFGRGGAHGVVATSTTSGGNAGSNYGAGGGGGANGNSGTGKAGGNGTKGIVVITEFCSQ